MKKEKDEKTILKEEVDSMNATTIECNGYKRLNFSSLNFSGGESTDNECTENVNPIKWSKEVLSGAKEVIIKKQ